MKMADLAGRRPPRAPLPPVDVPPVAEPAAAPALPVAKPATAQLDSLLAQLVDEAPAVPPRRAAPRPVSPPATPAEPPSSSSSRRLPWRTIGLAAASTLLLVGVAFAPRLRGLLAGPSRAPDGTPAPLQDGYDRWRASVGDGYL